MAWNNGYPATYQQMYQQYNPYQAQQMAQQMGQTAPASRLVEVFPAESVEYAEKFPVNAGATVMFFGSDDSFTAVKSVGVNGQISFVVYDKRPPAPPAPKFDPGEFVRKDEFNERLNAILDVLEANKKEQPDQTAQKAPQRKVKQEVE